ncbi:hypothetical protein HID58_013750 [Brassica napus]|uniref:Uncharacterized protein n=1 Tax=Brassica napus TaxID=3708 RepID=A0ABQ7XH60_BRANA|nr:hypothetical protein HID58_013750 [Brassica napus]
MPIILADPDSSLSQFKTVMEVEPPSLLRYLIGSAVMMIGVVLPLGYMMFRNKRVQFTLGVGSNSAGESMEQSFDLESLETAVNSNWIDKDDDILSDMDMIVLVSDMGL